MAVNPPGGAGSSNAPPGTYLRALQQPAQSIGELALAASKAFSTRPGIVVGWSVRESSGSAAAAVRILDGQATGSQLVASVGVASGASSHGAVGGDGVFCDGGVFVEIVSGQADVAVWVKM